MKKTLRTGRGRRGVLIYLLLVGGAAALYLPHAGIPVYGDDFEFRFVDPRPYIFGAFGYSDLGWFRPIKASWCALNQYLFGENTFVLQTGHVFIHSLLACFLFGFMRDCGLGQWPAGLGSVWFLVNPINVSAVLGSDTTDQIGSGAAGFLSFALAWRFCKEERQLSSGDAAPLWLMVGSLIALGLAMLFKESGLAFAGILWAILGFAIWRDRCRLAPGTVRRVAIFFILSIMLTAGYFIYRDAARDPRPIIFGTGRYQFRIGTNILSNEILLLVAPLIPFSTVDAYIATVRRVPLSLTAMSFCLLAWLLLLSAGATIARRWPAVLGLGILASCAGVPVVFLNHVSELYAYNVAPFWAVVVALTIPPLLEPHRPQVMRVTTAVFASAVLVSSVIAVKQKASYFEANGHNAAILLPQVVEFAKQLPPQGTLFLYDRRDPGTIRYSEFLGDPLMSLDDTGLRNGVGPWVKHLARRPDIRVKYVTEEPPHESADIVLVPDVAGKIVGLKVLSK